MDSLKAYFEQFSGEHDHFSAPRLSSMTDCKPGRYVVSMSAFAPMVDVRPDTKFENFPVLFILFKRKWQGAMTTSDSGYRQFFVLAQRGDDVLIDVKEG